MNACYTWLYSNQNKFLTDKTRTDSSSESITSLTLGPDRLAILFSGVRGLLRVGYSALYGCFLADFRPLGKDFPSLQKTKIRARESV